MEAARPHHLPTSLLLRREERGHLGSELQPLPSACAELRFADSPRASAGANEVPGPGGFAVQMKTVGAGGGGTEGQVVPG